MIQRLQLQQTARPMDVLTYWRKDGCLLLDPPYQRGDVWGTLRRRNLIRSLLMGVPIPSIVVNDRREAGWVDDWSYAVIDGKQRVTTILMFLDGVLSIPGDWVGVTAQEVTFPKLALPDQRRIRNYTLSVSEGKLSTLEAEREVFELINYGGVPQGQSDLD